MFYKHFGSTDSENLMSKIRFLVKGCECDYIFLDHINMVVSGIEGDERKLIDYTMTKLRTLVEECNFGLIVVCHLKELRNAKILVTQKVLLHPLKVILEVLTH